MEDIAFTAIKLHLKSEFKDQGITLNKQQEETPWLLISAVMES